MNQPASPTPHGPDALERYQHQEMQAVLEHLTKQMLEQYIRNHELSRGARVGEV